MPKDKKTFRRKKRREITLTALVPDGIAYGVLVVLALGTAVLSGQLLFENPGTASPTLTRPVQKAPGVHGLSVTPTPDALTTFEFDCTNGIDDDGDGLDDATDPDCPTATATTTPFVGSTFEYDCADGNDNDGDGLIDEADNDCASLGTSTAPAAIAPPTTTTTTCTWGEWWC